MNKYDFQVTHPGYFKQLAVKDLLFLYYMSPQVEEKMNLHTHYNETRKIVFSNSITSAPWGKWPEAEIMQGEAVKAIKALKLLPGKDLVMWGSISLAQALVKENLVDEYHIQLCPVLTGGGRKLFPELLTFNRMKLVDVKKYETGNVLLKYLWERGRE